MSFPLDIAKICNNCQFIFAGGDKYCLKCGSKEWAWLTNFIKQLKEATEKIGGSELKQQETQNEKDSLTIGDINRS